MKRILKRMPATEVKTHFGQVVQEVAASGTPVIIQTRGQDLAAIVSLQDLQRLSTVQEHQPAPARERVRAALRAAGLLSETAPEERCRAEEYNAEHTRQAQERILAELRSLHLQPRLSDVIMEGRNWRPGPEHAGEE